MMGTLAAAAGVLKCSSWRLIIKTNVCAYIIYVSSTCLLMQETLRFDRCQHLRQVVVTQIS